MPNALTSEALVHERVCDYLRYQYPSVLFRTDYAAGLKLTMGQAIRHKRLQAVRAWPDLQVCEPRGKYHGLFLELKREGATVRLKNGSLSSNPHIVEQAAILRDLRSRGYYADFGIGFIHAKQLIDWYLRIESLQEVPETTE